MSLQEFESRMLKLKGVKLPAVSLIGTEASKFANRTIELTPNNLVDTVLAEVDKEYKEDHVLDDILMGIVRSFDVAATHKGHKLNVAVVRSILHKLPVISTKGIMDNFGYSRSHAKHYAYACRLVLQFKSMYEVRLSLKRLQQFGE